jgi:hypothetical protein
MIMNTRLVNEVHRQRVLFVSIAMALVRYGYGKVIWIHISKSLMTVSNTREIIMPSAHHVGIRGCVLTAHTRGMRLFLVNQRAPNALIR